MSACFLVPWKLAQVHGDAAHAVLVLLVCAAVFATVLLSLSPRETTPRPASLRTLFLVAGVLSCFTLGGNWLSALAVARVSGALLAVLQRAEVIVVALLGAAWLGERVHPAYWVGTAVAALGLWLLGRDTNAAGGFDPAGVIYGVGAACCFGAMPVLVRRHVEVLRLGQLNALRLWLGVLLWFATERRIPAASELPWPLLGYGALAAFFGPFLSRTFMLLSARSLPANLTALAQLVIPVLALAVAYIAIGELPAPRELQGGAIMLLGIALPLAAMRARAPRA